MSNIFVLSLLAVFSACVEPIKDDAVARDSSDVEDSASASDLALERGYEDAQEGTAAWANTLALPTAQEWATDARLSFVEGDGISTSGIGGVWTLYYTSESNTSDGYTLSVDSNGNVTASSGDPGGMDPGDYFTEWYIDSDVFWSMIGAEITGSILLLSGFYVEHHAPFLLPDDEPDDLPLWAMGDICLYSARDGSLFLLSGDPPADYSGTPENWEVYTTRIAESCPH